MPRKVSARASRVWGRLGQWYGSRLADNYGPEPPEDWRAVIDRTDDERLDTALLEVRRETPIHPPTLGQLEAKIPAKRFGEQNGGTSPEILCEWAVQSLRHTICKHQIARTWNYFGQVKEFVSKHCDNAIIKHPEIRGVQIPACEPCELGTHRVLLADVPRGFDPSRKHGSSLEPPR